MKSKKTKTVPKRRKSKPKIVVEKVIDELLPIQQIADRVQRDRRTVERILDDAGVRPAKVKDGVRIYSMSIVAPLVAGSRSADQESETTAALKDRKLTQEIRKLTIANDQKMRRLLDREKFDGCVVKIGAEMRNILRLKLSNECAAKVVSLDVAQARVYLDRVSDDIMASFQKLAHFWTI